MKKTIIVGGSIRKNGTCSNILKLFQKELKDKGTLFSLAEKKVGFCNACLLCDKSRKINCVMKDDYQLFIREVEKSKNIVFVTPIYGGNITGIMKNFIDRTNHYFNFNKLKGKKMFLILTGCLPIVKGESRLFENKKPINRIKEFFKEYAGITCCDFEYLGYYRVHPDKGNIFKDYPSIENDVKKYCDKLK